MSTAMIVAQPETEAAMTALIPTAPAPKTAMLVPASGFRTFSTPPAPVDDPLPPDWRDLVPARLAELAEAWQQPDAWTGMTRAGGVDLPGEVAGLVALVPQGQDAQPRGELLLVGEAGACRDGRIHPRGDLLVGASGSHPVIGDLGPDEPRADHHQVPMAMGGVLPDALAHASCNRRAGAILGNRLRGARRRGAQRQAEIVGRVPTRRATGTPSRAW